MQAGGTTAGVRHPSGAAFAVIRPLPPVPAACATAEPPGTVGNVRCPACGELDDKVVDSRASDDGASIRRRRECLTCGGRFTTFERLEERAPVVVKRSGDRSAFEREKVVVGVQAAAKGRPITPEQVDAIADDVEEHVRGLGGEVSSEQVGLRVLDHLRELDEVAFLRFASVYKGFDEAADFQREITLLQKTTEPKRR